MVGSTYHPIGLQYISFTVCNTYHIYIYIPGTQMGPLVLNGKGLLLEGSDPKIEDKQVPGIYTYIYIALYGR